MSQSIAIPKLCNTLCIDRCRSRPARGRNRRYRAIFFEVLTGKGIKMLHEMRPGESGSLVVSTPILARYRIGDVMQCVRPPYFRCIGREKDWWTKPYYWWGEVSSFNRGRL